MALWKITDKGPAPVKETKFKDEKLLEEHLEDWISTNPDLLGEPLLVFGRQVLIPDTKDRLDLLAVDPRGMIVVIELKRGQLKDPVDVQSMRYASYLEKWAFKDFENVAKNYFGKVSDPEFNFNSIFESFCAEAGVDEIPDLNKDQRIIIVGSSVREKLGSVALWLLKHNVDIKLIEVSAYKEGNTILIEPSTIVPMPLNRFESVGKPGSTGNQPWGSDGRTWHLEHRCSPKTKDMAIKLDQIIQDEFNIDGPSWNQKYYIAYQVNGYNWLCVHTKPSVLILDFLVKAKSFRTEPLAKQLDVKPYDMGDTLGDKLGMPSSVYVRNRNPQSDRIRLRIKEGYNLNSDTFKTFLKSAFEAFSKEK